MPQISFGQATALSHTVSPWELKTLRLKRVGQRSHGADPKSNLDRPNGLRPEASLAEFSSFRAPRFSRRIILNETEWAG